MEADPVVTACRTLLCEATGPARSRFGIPRHVSRLHVHAIQLGPVLVSNLRSRAKVGDDKPRAWIAERPSPFLLQLLLYCQVQDAVAGSYLVFMSCTRSREVSDALRKRALGLDTTILMILMSSLQALAGAATHAKDSLEGTCGWKRIHEVPFAVLLRLLLAITAPSAYLHLQASQLLVVLQVTSHAQLLRPLRQTLAASAVAMKGLQQTQMHSQSFSCVCMGRMRLPLAIVVWGAARLKMLFHRAFMLR